VGNINFNKKKNKKKKEIVKAKGGEFTDLQ
jgi:hypothetical protein